MAQARQTIHSSFGRGKRIALLAVLTLALCACAVVIGMSIALHYEPPAMDEHRQKGSPMPEESYLYREVETDYGYSFGIAANLYRRDDGSVNVFFANPIHNSVTLMCEVKDAETEETYYKSGRIAPGEFIENLPPVGSDRERHEVRVFIYAFEESDFTSAGTTKLNLTLQSW